MKLTKKVSQKIEKQLCQRLTQVCEQHAKDLSGFEWLTHTVDYQRFPESLKVICMFDDLESVAAVINHQTDQALKTAITDALSMDGIAVPKKKNWLILDTEEACTLEHNGNWQRRLSS